MFNVDHRNDHRYNQGMENEMIIAEIENLSDGMLLFELTGDASFLTDDEILAELAK